MELLRGWQPVADNAAISIQADEVFSSRSPLVGGYSSASAQGHVLHDLGPLLSWMLAVPIRLDPSHGLLWGAAFWCAVAFSVAVEAVWRRSGGLAALVVALFVADLFWLEPNVALNFPWNPNVGLLFFSASIPVAWVVAAGSFRWWSALVVLGSVAAQCHLFYAVTAAALIIGSPLFATLVGARARNARWLAWGLVVGFACWAVPLVQQVTGHPGNVTELLQHHPQPNAGAAFGLRQVGLAALHPVWATGLPTPFAVVFAPHRVLGVAEGLMALGTGVAVGAWAWWRRCLALAALCGIWVVVAGGLALSFAALPTMHLFIHLAYLEDALLPLGFLTLAIAIWAGVNVVVALIPTASAFIGRHTPILSAAGPVAVLGLVLVLGVTAVSQWPGSAVMRENTGAAVAANERLANEVEHAVPRGPVALLTQPGAPVDAVGVAWKLLADGWSGSGLARWR
jgi:hypothetical protein